MSVRKRAFYKSLFIVGFVILMLLITKLLSRQMQLPDSEALVYLLSGTAWSIIAEIIFDRHIHKRAKVRKDNVNVQLKEIKHDLHELKEIITK